MEIAKTNRLKHSISFESEGKYFDSKEKQRERDGKRDRSDRNFIAFQDRDI